MKRTEIIARLNEAETAFPVAEWKWQGFHVWPLLRILIGYALSAESDYRQEGDRAGGRGMKLSRALSLVRGLAKSSYARLADHQRNASISEAVDFVFLSHSTCRNFIDGKWYDIFCDPYIEELERRGKGCFVFEYVPNYEFRIPRYGPSRFVQLKIDGLRAYNTLYQRSAQDAVEFEGIDGLDRFLKTHCSETPVGDPRKYLRQLPILRWLAEFYKSVMVRMEPSVGIGVCYYTLEGMAFNLACRELGIPSLDIQHGVQGETHIAYADWSVLPTDGFELLPEIFWCWSESEMRVLSRWRGRDSSRHRVVVGGNLWLNMWRGTGTPLVRRYDREIEKLKEKHDGKATLLVTLQPGAEPLSGWLLDYIQQTASTWRWWIRLHPGMALEKGRFRRSLDLGRFPEIELDAATDLPIYGLLRHTDIHITKYSSTVLEAEAFDIPSIVTDPIGLEVYPELIEAGKVLVASNEEELDSTLSRLSARDRTHSRSSVAEPTGVVEAIDLLLDCLEEGPKEAQTLGRGSS